MVAPIGVCFILVAILVLIVRRRYQYVLAVGMLAPAGYAIIIGSNGVPVFYLAAIGAAGLLTLNYFGTIRRTANQIDFKRPGRMALLIFAAWAGLTTIISPVIFSGIPVLTPRNMVEYGYLSPGALEYTISNYAQIVYLLLALCVVFFLSKNSNGTPAILSIGLGIATVLSFAQVLSHFASLAWPDEFFVNVPGGGVIDGTTSDGDVRFRGIYTEPSALAIGSLVSVVYFLTKLPGIAGIHRRTAAIVVLIMGVINLVVSTSSTALLGAASMAILFTCYGSYKFIFRGARVRLSLSLVVLMLAAPILIVLPSWVATIKNEVIDKAGGISYDTRMGGNLMSFDVLLDTWFLGAGLGSHKPFALWATLIANTGLIGTAAFYSAALILISHGWKHHEIRPVAWALITALVAKSFAGSALTEPIIWVCLGILANTVWRDPQLLSNTVREKVRVAQRSAALAKGRI